jgi:hypothetical protein
VPPLRVQVLDARRVAAATLRLEMAVLNQAIVPVQPVELEVVRGTLAAFSGVSLVSADGRRRVFPLHDSAGKIAWSGVEVPAPGQRRSFWVLFPAPVPDSDRVTLVLPGLPPITGIPVSAQAAGSEPRASDSSGTRRRPVSYP